MQRLVRPSLDAFARRFSMRNWKGLYKDSRTVMEILIGKGIDSIRFGQVESQIIEQLGEPNKTYELEDSKRLQYFDLQIEVSLENERENRFGWVEVKNPNATLFGQKMIGERAEKVLSVVSATITESPEHEDYGSLVTYFYESQWLELQFELNQLRSINIGVLWIDNETPNWP